MVRFCLVFVIALLSARFEVATGQHPPVFTLVTSLACGFASQHAIALFQLPTNAITDEHAASSLEADAVLGMCV